MCKNSVTKIQKKKKFFISQQIELSSETQKIAKENNFEVKGYSFTARKEDLRKPRIVRVAAVQNSIAASPSEPVHVQIKAIHAKITTFIKAAAASDVNILCLQELWSKSSKQCVAQIK